MSEPTQPAPKELRLTLPDWGELDTVRQSPEPFALWQVGDQPLLYHWLDHAIDEGFDKVLLRVADRPAAIRAAMKQATLWRLDWEVQPVSSSEEEGSLRADRLPGSTPLDSPPADGWALLHYWLRLQKDWLEALQQDEASEYLSIGRYCRIHPSTKIHHPIYLGDHVAIGPDCEIGPYTTIAQGSMLAGDNHLSHAHVGPNTYLGPVTGLENAILDHGTVFNCTHQAKLDRIEDHVLGTFRETPTKKVRLGEKLEALKLWLLLRWRGAQSSLATEGLESTTHLSLARVPEGEALWHERLAWLPEVWRGKMHLFGVLPRSFEELDRLSHDWSGILRSAPVGVFSYADCHQCHRPGDDTEALHAVYQSTQPEELIQPVIRTFLAEALQTNLRAVRA
ncbi:MAG: hypothetical protein AAF555_03455 [Verrucomicrobiota bacterium]